MIKAAPNQQYEYRIDASHLIFATRASPHTMCIFEADFPSNPEYGTVGLIQYHYGQNVPEHAFVVIDYCSKDGYVTAIAPRIRSLPDGTFEFGQDRLKPNSGDIRKVKGGWHNSETRDCACFRCVNKVYRESFVKACENQTYLVSKFFVPRQSLTRAFSVRVDNIERADCPCLNEWKYGGNKRQCRHDFVQLVVASAATPVPDYVLLDILDFDLRFNTVKHIDKIRIIISVRKLISNRGKSSKKSKE